MPRTTLGTAPDYDEYVLRSKAVGISGASYAMLRYWSRNGLLRTKYNKSTQKTRYCVADLLQLRLHVGQKLDPAVAAGTAERAMLIAQQTSRQLQELTTFLGLGEALIDSSDEAMVALYGEADHLSDSDLRLVSSEEVLRWAKLTGKFSSQYLRLMSIATGDAQSWKPFLRLVERLLVEASENLLREFDPPMFAALGYLDFSRKLLLGSIAEIRNSAVEQTPGCCTRDRAVASIISLLYMGQ